VAQPGDLLTVTIEKPVAGGRMLARHDGQVIFVLGAIPGERGRVRIDRVSGRVAFGTAVEIMETSPDRREPESTDLRCGGNVYAHVSYARQRHLKADVIRDAFARLAHIVIDQEIAVEPSVERGYRMRARLHGRDRRLGFFREGTHELCDASRTGQILESTDAALRAIAGLFEGSSQFPIAVDLAENIPATERALHLEMPGDSLADLKGLTDEVPGVTALSASTETDSQPLAIRGQPFVNDSITIRGQGASSTIRLRRYVRAFFQGNRHLLVPLVERVIVHVPPGEPVLDLYAGGGLFAVSLAALGWPRVTAVEGDPVAADDLRWNGRLYGRVLRTVRRSVETYLSDHPTFDGTVIVDPPRTGLSADICRRIASSRAWSVVYVSCDVATLARDVGRLVAGGYTMNHVEAFDLFPNTAHVETIVVMTRRAG
jgi:tRNA/tmRNA/rRNA uracil-C5-methylase (TrmA/RlmC/RlmD family)